MSFQLHSDGVLTPLCVSVVSQVFEITACKGGTEDPERYATKGAAIYLAW